jgi:hypothetical protein
MPGQVKSWNMAEHHARMAALDAEMARQMAWVEAMTRSWSRPPIVEHVNHPEPPRRSFMDWLMPV